MNTAYKAISEQSIPNGNGDIAPAVKPKPVALVAAHTQTDQAVMVDSETLIAEIAAGRMVIVVDNDQRENEGDLVIAAEHAGAQAINFMASYGRGLICLALTPARLDKLELPLQPRRHQTQLNTAFTLSIEARNGISTGISAADRAQTIAVAIDPNAGPEDINTPGHVFPLRAQENGVLARAGHTEAGIDLARLAGKTPAAVICEVMRDDGQMARLPDLITFAAYHGLKIGRIDDLIGWRRHNESKR